MDSQQTPAQPEGFVTHLLITGGVIFTVLLALLLGASEIQPNRIVDPSPENPIIAQATIIAATGTPLTPVPIPSATATSAPTSAPGTAVAVLPNCGDVPFGWVQVTVQPGDTLFALSLKTGTSITEIEQANCLVNGLYAGSRIYLPLNPNQPDEPDVCAVPPDWVQYIVQPGDTLFSLSQQRGTTPETIARANCLDQFLLFTGQLIFLPSLPTTPTHTPVPTAVPPTQPPQATNTPQPPSPTETAVPSSTPTLAPTHTATTTPSVTAVPSATPTIRATETTVPTATSTATNTPQATSTATPSPTVTSTPAPTATATVPPTATPTATIQPTATNTAEPTATNSATPPPTDTPAPTETPTPTTSP